MIDSLICFFAFLGLANVRKEFYKCSWLEGRLETWSPAKRLQVDIFGRRSYAIDCFWTITRFIPPLVDLDQRESPVFLLRMNTSGSEHGVKGFYIRFWPRDWYLLLGNAQTCSIDDNRSLVKYIVKQVENKSSFRRTQVNFTPKLFDRVRHHSMVLVLKAVGFGLLFKRWITTIDSWTGKFNIHLPETFRTRCLIRRYCLLPLFIYY